MSPDRRRRSRPDEEFHFIVPGALDRPTGGDRYDSRMVKALRARGWSVEVHGLEGSFPRTDEAGRMALDAVLRGLPDDSRVLVDGLVLGGLPGPAARHADRHRILALVHHPLADETGRTDHDREAYRASERRALDTAVGVVVTSRHTADRVHEAFGVPVDRVRVAPPGTDPAPPARGPTPGEPARLLSVGSLIPRKGQDVLIAALGRLRDLRWSLVCAGSPSAAPEYARRVEAAATEMAIQDRVRFPGRVSEEALADLFHSSSVFVLASHYEGYGMALTEALIRGLPVVSTTGGAIPETVPDDTALLVPPGDPDALAGALRLLLEPSGADRLKEMARAARRHGAALPDWNAAAGVLGRAVEELAARREGSSGTGKAG